MLLKFLVESLPSNSVDENALLVTGGLEADGINNFYAARLEADSIILRASGLCWPTTDPPSAESAEMYATSISESQLKEFPTGDFARAEISYDTVFR